MKKTDTDLIFLCEHWHTHHKLTLRDIETTLKVRGLNVDHTSIGRWIKKNKGSNNSKRQHYLDLKNFHYKIHEVMIQFNGEKRKGYLAIETSKELLLDLLFIDHLNPLEATYFFSKTITDNKLIISPKNDHPCTPSDLQTPTITLAYNN
ncbi:MAG: IS6 family transposase, partial [Oligoflexia bacterium]|nr:IS6 family transposase [Oligoflexia bacterium]